MNQAQFETRVLRLAAQRGLTLDIADISESMSLALEALGRETAMGPEYALLQKEYSVTLTSGVASLASHSDMLIDRIETVKHPDIDGAGTAEYFSRIPDGTRIDLTYPRSMFKPVVLENKSLYLSMGRGDWPAADDLPPDETLVVLASFSPTIAEVPLQLEERLIEIGVEVSQQE